MSEGKIGFIIWALCGLFFVGMGIYCLLKAERSSPFGFWANAKTPPIDNVPAYNRALGKLWCVTGTLFILLGLPLLAGGDSPLVFLSVLGTVLLLIGVMLVYVLKIEGKYRKK